MCAQKRINLTGEVLNDTIDVSSLTVVNLNLEKGTTTTNSGVFTIPACEGDTINISAVQYMSRQFVVTPVIFSRKKITLYLEPKITELDAVEISNTALTGNLEKDVLQSKLKRQITAKELGIPENRLPPMTVEERRLYSATSGAGAIGALLNAISGRTKMLKKHLAVSKLERVVHQNRDRFSDSLFIKELRIPQNLIEDFVYFVFEDHKASEYVDADDLLELFKFMIQKSELYLQRKEAEKTSNPWK